MSICWLSLMLALTGCQHVQPRSSGSAALAEARPAPEAESALPDSPAAEPEKRYQKWNPVWWFGNIDDPEPPEWYRPENRARTFLWHCRNPFHNFTFYVIGIGDKDFERVGKHPERVFSPDGGWNWAVCKYKALRLPFVSYARGGFKTYCGWRNGGNLGLKLVYSPSRPRAKAAPAGSASEPLPGATAEAGTEAGP